MARSRTRQSQDSNLFPDNEDKDGLNFQSMPLSARMRPGDLSEYVGQTHILGEGQLLTRAIGSDRLTSVILYGPPGCGKTTLAQCISTSTQAVFERINAVTSSVEDLRHVLFAAQNRLNTSHKRTILFIDEIHAFNKTQQSVLMPDVEGGTVILIGATAQNPFFSLIGPLLSRSLVFELKPLSSEEVKILLLRAIQDKKRGFGEKNINIEQNALNFLSEISDGDGRRALNALEIGVLTTPENKEGVIAFTLEVARQSTQKKHVNFDRDGDGHYDTISAFIKAMRGSDPDAALYWLAKMIYAGEDPRFIARRICICASEDVGNADPQALVLAQAAMQTAEFVGMPEARIPLAQAAVYVASAPKSNAVYLGIEAALADVKDKRVQEVPVPLKDGSYPGAKKLGHGQGYKYAHNYSQHYVPQEYMPEKKDYYKPTDIGFERKIKEWLKQLKNPV